MRKKYLLQNYKTVYGKRLGTMYRKRFKKISNIIVFLKNLKNKIWHGFNSIFNDRFLNIIPFLE